MVPSHPQSHETLVSHPLQLGYVSLKNRSLRLNPLCNHVDKWDFKEGIGSGGSALNKTVLLTQEWASCQLPWGGLLTERS